MSDKKSAMALVATNILDSIILERHLINILPKNRQYPLKSINKLTGFNLFPIRNYINSDLFDINGTTLVITDNNQFLSEKSKIYCEKLIKKIVFPSEYYHDEFIYNIGKLFDNSYYTSEETKFIELMLDKLNCIIYNNITIRKISSKDLLNFNLVHSNGFDNVAQDVYNAILQKKLHAGDNIMSYITHYLNDTVNVSKILDSSCTFDYFFNKNATLQCDLDTNINILIKNFLNLSIYNFNDIITRTILLQKLNSKHSFLIRDKIFPDFE